MPAPPRKTPAKAQAALPLSTVRRSRRVSSLTWLAMIPLVIGLVIASVSLWRSRNPKVTGDGAVIRSIAVLPFKPLVADNRDESLEMGIADTLIFRLSSIRGIAVRPISAVRKYTDLNQDPLAAGREQQVDGVLDGSIQRVGDRVRVMARLVSVADGAVLWADKGEEEGAGLFAVQDAIAEKLAGSLAPKLTDEERERLTKRYTNNAEAYRLYLLGRYFLNKRTPEGYQKGVEYFQQAIEKDPAYALAHSGLADCYTSLGSWQILPPNESFLKARAAAERALRLDNELAEAHTSLALVKNYTSDWPEAEAEFKRAIELNPNNEAAHRWYGLHLMGIGRLDEALAETRRALEFEPLSLPYNTQLGRIFYLLRQYDQAVEQYQKTLEIDPNFVIAHLRHPRR
jgi:TolB-like protein